MMKNRWKVGVQGLVMALFLLPFTVNDVFAYPGICESKKVIPRTAPDYRALSIICNDPLDELQHLDRELDGYYRAAMERSQDREKLRQEQRAWLKQRNACDTKQCVGRAYHRRILELTLVPAKAAIHEFKSRQVSGIPSFFITREMGLKYFDGGKSDYDLVAIASGNEYDLTKPCVDRFDLIGTGVSTYAPCKGPEYGVYKPVTTFDSKRFQLFLAHELEYRGPWKEDDDPNMKDSLLYDDPYMASLLDGTQISYERSSSGLWPSQQDIREPFRSHIVMRDSSGKIVWSKFMVGRRVASNKSDGTVRPEYFGFGFGFIFLADGSVVARSSAEAFRLNLNKATTYDDINARSFTLEQVLKWKEDWAHDYLKKTPACGNDITKCPDREAALGYLWHRFTEEMDRQFATPAQ